MLFRSPFLDHISVATKDRPCNDLLMFKIRDGKLNLTVINRSNDITLGLFNVNIIQFTTIQQAMAHLLGVDLGVYRHVSDSFHMYTDEPWKTIQARVSAGYERGHISYYTLDDINLGCGPLFLSIENMDHELGSLFEVIDAMNCKFVRFKDSDIGRNDCDVLVHCGWTWAISLLAAAHLNMQQGHYTRAAELAVIARSRVPDFATMFMQTLYHRSDKHAKVKDIIIDSITKELFDLYVRNW